MNGCKYFLLEGFKIAQPGLDQAIYDLIVNLPVFMDKDIPKSFHLVQVALQFGHFYRENVGIVINIFSSTGVANGPGLAMTV